MLVKQAPEEVTGHLADHREQSTLIFCVLREEEEYSFCVWGGGGINVLFATAYTQY